MKRFFYLSLAFMLLGAILMLWLAPNAISWYFTPPMDILTCKKAVDWGLETYRRCLLGGAIMGFLLGAVLFFAFSSKKKQALPEPKP